MPELSNPTKDQFQEIETLVDLILDGKTESISFIDYCYKIYLICSFGYGNDLLSMVEEKFQKYIHDYFVLVENFDIDSENSKQEAIEYINKIGNVHSNFVLIASSLASIFAHIFIIRSGENTLFEYLEEIFLKEIKSSDSLNLIIESIILIYDNFLDLRINEEELKTNPLLISTTHVKQLLIKAMPQKLRTLSTGIEQRCISYFHQFSTNFYQPTQSSESVNDSESFSGSPSLVQQIVDEPANDIDNIKLYITESNRLLQAQFIATKLIIDENTASILQSKARNELTNPETAVIQFCLSKIPVIISKREITVLTQFFALCQYNLTTCDLIIENVLKQISEEPTELDKLIEAISFYHLICDKCFASNIKYKKMIHNGLYKLVNSQTKNIIINVLRRINTEALKDSPDISDLKELLNYFEQKTELISVHTRHAARRLVKNYDLQIDQETQIYAQLLHISDKFDLSQLKMLINGAEQSVNLHIGPVLIVNTSAWPFHPPYPNPLLLSDVASEITTKYNKLFTGRVLHFPINHWFVNVRDTVNGYVFVCTGVQAEILLYFNKHILIAETSLEPNIGQQFAVAALKAMADETAPVLRLKEDVYVMNQDFRYDRIVKLKQPAIRDEIAESKLVNDTKNNMMDSVIVREMKQKRVVNLRDIDALVKNALATRFSVSSEDIHKRIESLIAREYIEYFGKDKLRYLA